MQNNKQPKKAVYHIKGQPKNRLILFGIYSKQQAQNLLDYVCKRKGWQQPEQVLIKVKNYKLA